jgi:Ca2+-binding RTX toxin-like protein
MRGIVSALAAAVLVAMGVLAGAATATAARATRASALAAALVARDPGARTGANTIVAAANGDRILGVKDRSNFIAALGTNQTIIGGNRHDNLGARGDNATIRAGKGGAFVYGGRGATLIGGPAKDVLVDQKPDAVLKVSGDGDTVVAGGAHDKVVCPAGSKHDVIYAGATDVITPTCRHDHARILALTKLRRPRPNVTAKAAAISGNGSNDSPFIAPCDDPGDTDCSITAFPTRTLSGAWASEYVPAYKCPPDHPYLYFKGYAPFGVALPPGFEIHEDQGSWAIGISITGKSTVNEGKFDLFAGSYTGFPNSSANNWLWGGSHWYQVELHCTSDRCHGTDNVGPPPDCPSPTTDDRRARVTQ